ncbi:hypothetical protein GTY41_33135 [Streptomyces sp. SID685]|nr:hypothetical protein [Streptomyces sp. SID685]
MRRAAACLATGAQGDLGRLITRMNAELERRTLPEPNNIELAMFGWWWTRMRER